VYFKQYKPDIVFKYWEQESQLTSFYIVCTGFFLNFRVYRMYYSRFQDRKDLNAVFQDQTTFYRSIILSSAFYLLTGTVPILVASCFGMWYIPFGYQVQMFCLEMIILEALLLVLMSIELFKIGPKVVSKQYTKIKPSQIASRYEVMAGVPEEQAFSQAETEETMLLQKLIKRINVRDAGKRKGEHATLQEIQELHDEQALQHQMRRCISFKEIREYQDEKDPM
jgi:hypothetical protein